MATILVNPTGIVTTTTSTRSSVKFTIPIYVTSASLSSGAILLYP